MDWKFIKWVLALSGLLLMPASLSLAQLSRSGASVIPEVECTHLPCFTDDDCAPGGPNCGKCTAVNPPVGEGRCQLVE